MPTYVYETVPSDGSEPRQFEVQQKLADPPLTVDPESGEAVQRVMAAANLGGFAAAPSRPPCGMGACGRSGCGQGN